MRSKGIWAASLVLALLAFAAAPASMAGPRAPRGGVDADGDKIFDSLDRALGDAAANERLDVVVMFAGGTSGAKAAEARRAVGDFRTTYEYETIPAVAAEMTPEQVTALARRPDVVHVQEDSPVELASDSAKAAAGADRAATDFSVDGNNESSTLCPGIREYCRDDLVVAVLDSGIDTGHVDLDGGKVLGGADCSTGVCSGGMWQVDSNGHGTHVASIVAGEGDGDATRAGTAPGVALVSVKVGSTGSTVSALDASLEWVLANRATYGIEVVNMSLNGKTASDGTDSTSRLVNRLAAAGVVTFSAMGNGAPDPGSVSFPASAKYGVGVGNMSDPGAGPSGYGFALWWMSKRGPTADGRVKPDVLSYGVDITAAAANTGNGYKTSSGTSQATPMAAGVAALMLDANPSLAPSGTACAAGDLSPDCSDGVVDASMSVQVKDLINQTAVDWARPGLDNETGSGRLDAYAAVDAASALSGSNAPAAPTHTAIEGALDAGASADHTFSVADASIPVAATVVMVDRAAGATSPDFDLELLGPAGERLAYAAAEANFRQETVSVMPPATGTYTLRVISASGSGSYWLDVSYGGGATPTPSPTPTPAPTAAPTLPPLPAVPSVPEILSATPVAGSTSQIDLTWSDVSGETGYRIERSGDGVSGWIEIAALSADSTSHTDTGLAAGTTYYYRVKAHNAAGESAPSDVAWATTNSGDTTAPTTPASFKVSGGRGKIGLSWRRSTDSGGSELAGYKVFRSSTSTGTFTLLAAVTNTSYSDTDVTKGGTYWYYVVAYDGAGNHSDPTSTLGGKAS